MKVVLQIYTSNIYLTSSVNFIRKLYQNITSLQYSHYRAVDVMSNVRFNNLSNVRPTITEQ